MNLKFVFLKDSNLIFPLILIAFLIRLIFVVETTGSPFVSHLFSDSEIYMSYADNIVESGNWLGEEAFFMSPAYPYSIAIVKLIFGNSTLLIRFLQVIISTITLILIYLSAKKYFNIKTALLALVIAGFYDSFIFYSGIIFSETLQVFFITLLIYLFSLKQKYSDLKFWILTGFVFGIASVFRANILIFLPVFAIYILLDKKFSSKLTLSGIRIVLMFILGAFAAILPVTVRNAAVSGEFVLLTTNGGINFYIGNNEDAVGVFVTPDEFDYENDMAGRKYAEQVTGAELSSSEASSFWYNRTFEDILEHPGSFTALLGKKMLLFFDSGMFPQSSILDMTFYREHYSSVLKLPLINYSIISLLFIIGILLYVRQKDRDNLLLILVVSYILASILFFVNGRFRLGIAPAMILLASFAVFEIIQNIKSAGIQKLRIPLIILTIFIIVSFFVIDKPKFTNYDAYAKLGDIAQDNEEFDKAVYYYNRSIVLSDKYKTFMNLGNTFAKKHDFANALSAYAKAEERNADNHLLFFNRGIVLSQVGKYNEAVEQYNKALKLFPDFPPAIRNIGIIYFVNENYEDAKYFFNKFLEISDDEATNALVRKDLETIRRKLGSN